MIVNQDNFYILASFVFTKSSFAGLKKMTSVKSEARQNEKIKERKVRLTTHAICPEIILAVFINALQKRQAALPSPTRPF